MKIPTDVPQEIDQDYLERICDDLKEAVIGVWCNPEPAVCAQAEDAFWHVSAILALLMPNDTPDSDEPN